VSIPGEMSLSGAHPRKEPPSIVKDASSTFSEEYGKLFQQRATRNRYAGPVDLREVQFSTLGSSPGGALPIL